jgi:hypothetical protein
VGVLLEAARVVAEEPLDADTIFLVTTGEERGLFGARGWVAENDLSRLHLALTLDPVGYGELFVAPFPGPPEMWAVRQARSAARRSGADRFVADPLYCILPRLLPIGFGADHMAFLDAGVSSWNLSNRLERWNYHTERDTPDNLEVETLLDAGRISLATLAAAAEPGETDGGGRWLPLRSAWGAVLIPEWELWIVVALGALAGAAGAWAAFRREPGEAAAATARALLVWFLLVPVALLPAKALELLHGFRYAWWGAPEEALLLALAWGGALAWAALPLLRRGPGPAGAASLLAAAAALGAALAVGADVAFFPAWMALWFGLWTLAAHRKERTGPWFALGHAAVLLLGIGPLLSAVRPMLYRQAVELLTAGLDAPLGLVGAAIAVALLPAALFLASTPRGERRPTPWAPAALLAVAVLAFAHLASREPYTEERPRTVLVTERLAAAGAPSLVELRSFEKLRGLIVGDEPLDLSTARTLRPGPPSPEAFRADLDWKESGPGAGILRVALHADPPAALLGVRLRADGLSGEGLPEGEVARIVAAGERTVFEWEGEVRGDPGAILRVRARAHWDGDLLGLAPKGEGAVFDIVARSRDEGARFRFPEDSEATEGVEESE